MYYRKIVLQVGYLPEEMDSLYDSVLLFLCMYLA